MNKRFVSTFGVLLILSILFSGCDIFKGDKELSGDGDNKTNTALSTVMSNVALIPARGLKAVGATIAEGHAIYLVWEGVAYAKSYNIYVSDSLEGEFTLLGTNDSCEYYHMLPENLSLSSVNKFYKVAGVNQNEKEGAFSSIAEGNFKVSGSFEKKVEHILLSKGDSGGIVVTWTSEPAAFSYKIMRAKSGAGYENAEVAREVYVPVDNTLSMLSWTDRGVKPGFVYDYWVICVDENGIAGNLSNVGIGGYVRPYPQAVFALPSAVRGSGFSYIDICWEALWRLEDAQGPIAGSEAKEDTSEESIVWNVKVIDNPIDGTFYSMTSLPSSLSWLKAANNHGSFGNKLPGGQGVDSDSDLTTSPAKWTKDAHFPTLLKRLKNGDINLNTIEYCYRILVNTNANFEKTAYFVVSAIYKKSYFNEFETQACAMQEGFAIKPSVNINAPATVSATSTTPGIVNISWSSVSGASKYVVVRKKSTDYNFSKVQELNGTSFTHGDGSEDNSVEAGTWYYSVRAVNNTGESEFSMPVSVEVK